MNSSAGPKSMSPSERVPELDGLRGLAILLVVICHYIANSEHAPLGFWIHHFLSSLSIGWSGVDLFFVLSGFLIGGILLDSRESPRYFQTFYLRRIHRILPIYYAWIFLYMAVVSTAVLLIPRAVSLTRLDLAQAPKYLLFLQNMMYEPTRFQWQWFAVTWSLAVEEQFYLLAPPLIRFFSLRRLVVGLCSCVCIAPVLRYLALRHLEHGSVVAVFAMPCRADTLAFGILAAVAWRQPKFRMYLREHPAVLQRAAAWMLVGLAVLTWWLVRPVSVMTITVGYSWLAVFFTCFLLLVLSQTEGRVARVARWRVLRYLGGISYCVYLIHFTVNQLAHSMILHAAPRIYDLPGLAVTVLAALLTLVVADLSWRYFERPLIRRGHRYSY